MFEKRLQLLEQKRDKLAQDLEAVRAEIKLRDVFSRSVRNQNAADRKSSALVGKLVIQREIEQDGSASIDGNHRPAIAIGDALRVSSAIFHNSFDCQSACALPGTTFARVLDEMRRELAARYLEDKKLSISQVAWLIGFQEVAAFTHAFRRWTGKTPSMVRQAGISKS